MKQNGHRNGKPNPRERLQRLLQARAPKLQKPLPDAVRRQVERPVPPTSGPPNLAERLRQARDAQSLHGPNALPPRESMSMEERVAQALAEEAGSLSPDPNTPERPIPPEYLKIFGEF